MNDTQAIGMFMGFVMLAAIYFLPSIVAVFRSKSNTLAIFILNLFLGITFIGWVVALIWAVSKDNTALEK